MRYAVARCPVAHIGALGQRFFEIVQSCVSLPGNGLQARAVVDVVLGQQLAPVDRLAFDARGDRLAIARGDSVAIWRLDEARREGATNVVWDGGETNYDRLPAEGDYTCSPDSTAGAISTTTLYPQSG